ncbi:LpxI family protein [Halodesulfovibrio sp. MK-HDV]|uniref:LpxI family protein n=1 Tax=Halodesulfovibrio sp. MK-HDV TaxID=2599925 RepID=UPI00136E8252|nr:UDP-2,3-diacylglucosamine diphosphatase LpxI [Halodesulfovibrio sp. MK-HDV]KAF1074324.1 UDP-2,3-diacylglucosamine pyrophosphatase LpxI [Halodesulfovibrio sp. MK-HDV]
MAALQERIGIIAGAGQFPELVAQGAREEGLSVIMCGFVGHTDPAIESEADVFEMLHLGALSKLIQFFKTNGVTRVCFAGAINKPKALDIRPDLRAAKVLFKIRSKGDDVLLRGVLDELESDGLHIVQAAELVPNLRGPAGVLTKKKLTDKQRETLAYGIPMGEQIGSMDIGQCIVVREQMVIAVECLEGTDATIKRGAELGGKGCVAIKLLKPKQDERIDLPALGLNTVQNLVDGGYSCLAFYANKTLFFDRKEAIALANKHEIAIVGVDEDIINSLK